MVKTGEKYDVIVLDPPKFARDRRSVEDALRGYRRLYQLGLNLVSTNGLIVFCCCSGLITQDQIEDVMAQVASKHRRDVQILERRGAAADHPISVACREGSYLKCLITRVSGEPHESRHGPPPT
jgi:23S rRNA (cytosine1962-C5)-methyltransferase